jgi:pimeloyl-ACP methyl ester carboxylesterase
MSTPPFGSPGDPAEISSEVEPIESSPGVTRAELIHRGLAAGVALGSAGLLPSVAMAATNQPQAPHLPPGFNRIFASRYIHANGLRQHAVIGGEGPPLLLLHGWPQNWYQFRLIMPSLARHFRVIAVDQRGMGLTDKPRTGYDLATLADDVARLMDALGHHRFAVLGCDTGMDIGYALAADHPGRVARLVVGESVIPGVSPSPPILAVPGPLVGHVFHLLFNRLAYLNEELVRDREREYFGFIYQAEGGPKKLPQYAVKYYVDGFASSRAALSGSFGFYRALDETSAQNQERAKHALSMPVLAIGGALSVGEGVAETMNLVAGNVQGLVLDCGHWLAEEAPEDMLAAVTPFLAPFRERQSTVAA